MAKCSKTQGRLKLWRNRSVAQSNVFQFVSMRCSFDSGSIPMTQGTIRGLAMQHSVSVAFTVQEGVHSLHSEIPCTAFFLMDAQPHCSKGHHCSVDIQQASRICCGPWLHS